jgi:tRNA1(Val) A37 N6-methylase TrmN6
LIFNKLNNLSEKIEIINSDIKDIDKNISVDLIVSNPPYMKLDEGKISENHEKCKLLLKYLLTITCILIVTKNIIILRN